MYVEYQNKKSFSDDKKRELRALDDLLEIIKDLKMIIVDLIGE